MACEAAGYLALTLLLETEAARAWAERLDQLRVAPFLLRLGRRGNSKAFRSGFLRHHVYFKSRWPTHCA
jgi:hypothetical protein